MGGIGRPLVMIVAALLLAAGAAGADSTQAVTVDALDLAMLDKMLSSRSFLRPDGREQIQDLAARIPEERRFQLYYSFREDKALIGAGINLFLPTLGSLIQYDWVGAVVEAALLAAGFVSIIPYMWIGESYWEGIALGSAVAWAGFSVIRPFWWSSIYNRRLASSLLLPPKASRAPQPAEAGSRPSRSVYVSLLRIEY